MRPNVAISPKRTVVTKRNKFHDSVSDEEVDTTTTVKEASKSSGLNWTAVIILLMFLIPVVLAGVIQVSNLYM